MAGIDATSARTKLPLNSHQTALCMIPSIEQCREYDKLRALYDKGYGRWPPHINVLYPFVPVEDLSRAQELIGSSLGSLSQAATVRVNDAGYFSHRNGYTVFRNPSADCTKSLETIRKTILEALGHQDSSCNFHLTIGQSADQTTSSRDLLLSKAKLLPAMEFKLESLAILVRESSPNLSNADNRMRLWGFLKLGVPSPTLPEFWLQGWPSGPSELEAADESTNEEASADAGKLPAEITFHFKAGGWEPFTSLVSCDEIETTTTEILLSTYNVLADSEFPPLAERDPDLLRTILSDSAKADVLVLEEVTDNFLTYILTDGELQQQYTYASYGPSCQEEIGPLPSLRNVVVLSRFPFTWRYLPFHRRHKGAVIIQMENVGQYENSNFHPLIVAGVHLTSGLTDGSVAAKKVQMGRLLSYLKREHPSSPWMVTGDFNLTTSSVTIDAAIRDGSISEHTAKILTSIETDLVQARLLDAWALARVDASDESALARHLQDQDDIFEGEDGATFDPRENVLAAESSGTCKNRPQRYDRILIRSKGAFSVAKFNMFGIPDTQTSETTTLWPVPSDHYGIRAQFLQRDGDEDLEPTKAAQESHREMTIVQANLSSGPPLVETLSQHAMFPSEDESLLRQEAFSTLKRVILGSSTGGDAQSHLLLEIVTVGSYALGVWTASSDIDCLCIGNISSKTFFRLALQRLRKAATEDVRILRKVEANSGTMLEIWVKGVYMDLQYCPATKVVEHWSTFANLSATDPMFDLPILSLRKLKPYRDLSYIKRTLPDKAAFRLAYRALKLWAIQHGLYSSRFGYLGGIHLTLMLSVVCKRMAHQTGTVTAESLVASFFRHFANFDWASEMMYDPFFHKTRPRYHRTAREPMVILGFHTPNANVAHTSTVPGLRVIMEELKQADARLSDPSMTWQRFFDVQTSLAGTTDHHFLKSFDDFIRVDVQYWGRSLKEGKSLVGWLESRSLIIVVEIQKALPGIEVRIWPARFTSSDASNDQDYNGCYLIGLSRNASAEQAEPKQQRQAAKDQLITIMKRFEDQLRSDEKYYDASKSWLGVNLVKCGELGELHLDERVWGEHDFEDDFDSADDEPEIDEDEADESVTRTLPILPTSSERKPGESRKLRPASDVLNRLRWDPNLVLSDYIVGYEDRFLGAKETTLEKWKTEKTDEEFIPQHRILYFRRRGDGMVVWDRKARIDTIFGSGG